MSAELAAAWRARADHLEAYAERLREEGDTHGAEDAERAAADYRIAADERDATQVGR